MNDTLNINHPKILTNEKELKSLTQFLFTFGAILSGLAIMLFAFIIARNSEVRDPSIVNWQGAIWIDVLIAVGTSMIASTIFYVMYSRIAERRVLRDITTTASEYALSLFSNRFEKMLPIKVFTQSELPTEEFDIYFSKFLKDSKTYKFKGDAGSFTSFRLSCFFNKHHTDIDIILLLLDPRDLYLFEERAKIELSSLKDDFTKSDLIQTTEQIRNSVYVTLIALFDISHKINVEVAFHKELLFFRSEILDDGIFLSYYLGGDFPGTYLYIKKTFVYEAYLHNFKQNYNAATYRINFNSTIKDEDFISHLEKLGCSYNLDALRQLKKQRFEKYQEMITYPITEC